MKRMGKYGIVSFRQLSMAIQANRTSPPPAQSTALVRRAGVALSYEERALKYPMDKSAEPFHPLLKGEDHR